MRQACASDGAVLREVESLLAAEPQVGSFLETETREMPAEELVETRAPLVESFNGTDRFLLKKLLGYGGFGVVYEAYDRQRETPVALKRVRRSDPAQLYLIKREFAPWSMLPIRTWSGFMSCFPRERPISSPWSYWRG